MCEGRNPPDFDGSGAIDEHSLCQPDRAYQLRYRAALESFERICPNSGCCGGPAQTRNDDEEGIAGALETDPAGKLVRTGIWSYSKVLQRRPATSARNGLGEPNPDAYESLLHALHTTKPEDFEQVKITALVNGPAYRKLTNPQAGIDYDLEGLNSHAFAPPPAPSVTDPISSAEMGEDYWMAVLRDVHFKYYRSSYSPPDQEYALVEQAAHHLSSKNHGGDFSKFHWPPATPVPSETCGCCSHVPGIGAEQMQIPPFQAGTGKVTPDLLFRGFDAGSQKGPYVSQFLLRGNSDSYISGPTNNPILHLLQTPADGFFTDGTNPDNQRQKTVLGKTPTNLNPDFMITVNDWLNVQEGFDTTGRDNIDLDSNGKPVLRFIRNLRDLANYVHLCDVTSPYVNAAFIMFGENASAMNAQRVARALNQAVPPLPFPLNPGNPYSNAGNVGVSQTQSGFVTFDISHYASLVNEVAWKAHKLQWFQKWFVHRRMRPEEFGGRVHFQIANAPVPNPYPAIQNAEIIAALQNPAGLGHFYSNAGATEFKTYLLPQVFPEGSPTHPAYGEGHAVLGGACATILKAFFDDRALMTDPANTTPTPDPNRLPPAFIASDDGLFLVQAQGNQQVALTVGGELDKLAANIGLGRDAAGVHWRTDYIEGVLLGEAFAISVLLDQSVCYQLESTGERICSFNERRGVHFERPPYFEFTKFNGVRIRIADGRVRIVG